MSEDQAIQDVIRAMRKLRSVRNHWANRFVITGASTELLRQAQQENQNAEVAMWKSLERLDAAEDVVDGLEDA